MKKAALLCGVFLCIQCSEIKPGPPISAFVDVRLMDNGNNGNGGDIEVNLESQGETTNVEEYRFCMVKEADASSFGLSDAEKLEQDRFHAFRPVDVIKVMGTVLPASFTDVDGDLIQTDQVYIPGILTISADVELESNSLFMSSRRFQLSTNNLIKTFKTFQENENMAAGSLTGFDDDLVMSSYNVQNELSNNTLNVISPIRIINQNGGSSELIQLTGMLGGNDFDSKGRLYQTVSLYDLVVIDQTGKIEQTIVVPNNLKRPDGIFINESDDVFIVGELTRTIHKIDAEGNLELYATFSKSNAKGITGDSQGNLYLSHNNKDGYITHIDSNKQERLLAQIPTHIPADYALEYFMWVGYLEYYKGHVYVAGMSTDKIYKINVESGEVEHWAGSGQRGLARGGIKTADLNRPNGITLSSDQSRLFISGTTDVTPIHVQYSTPPIIWEIEFVNQ